MEGMEIIIFLTSLLSFFIGVMAWYTYVIKVWPNRYDVERISLILLPVISLLSILYVLIFHAASDVVSNVFYIVFYLLFGFLWLLICMCLFSTLFDIRWKDDAIERKNRSAILFIYGGTLAITAIYAGANIGEGPGWWCVFIAGGLGVVTWFILASIMIKLFNISEKITVERNSSISIRFSSYLLAIGLVLGRASAGDWTSFQHTFIEFLDGWPILILTILFIIIELYYKNENTQNRGYQSHNHFSSSIFWALIYIVIGIICIMLLPALPINPSYHINFGVFR